MNWEQRKKVNWIEDMFINLCSNREPARISFEYLYLKLFFSYELALIRNGEFTTVLVQRPSAICWKSGAQREITRSAGKRVTILNYLFTSCATE